MVDKARLEKLRRDLGNAHSEINKLKDSEKTLIEENKDIIDKLKKSNEALIKAESLVTDKRDNSQTIEEEENKLLEEVEKQAELLKKEIEELKITNQKLREQNTELKDQTNGVYIKSLAIVGIFAGGAWVAVGVKNWVDALRTRPRTE